MHLRVILGLIGQLIAVPAALFLVPTSCPDLNRSSKTEASDPDLDSSNTIVIDDLLLSNGDMIDSAKR